LQQAETHNGLGDPPPSRYILLLARWAIWLMLGAWLLYQASWPSACQPGDLVEIYACSSRLPESGGWLEGALLTWLWSSPILVALDLVRRFGARKLDADR
jgi:hypothetical protein